MTKNVSAHAVSLSRRKLLQASGIAAGGLLLATALPFPAQLCRAVCQ
ncbi:twin-arginine translocation signal domain-containing protein [Pseudomonas asuensis]